MTDEALVAISHDGTEAVIFTEDGFAASLVEGVWYEDVLYGYYDMEEFFAVTDERECLAILSTARKALEAYSPSSPGDRFAHLIEPLNRLHQSLEIYKVGRLEKTLDHFRLETVREWARLSLHRYSLRSSWIALLWQTLNSDALAAYPEADKIARDIAQTLYLTTSSSETKHEQ
jgi:hypothetical protein